MSFVPPLRKSAPPEPSGEVSTSGPGGAIGPEEGVGDRSLLFYSFPSDAYMQSIVNAYERAVEVRQEEFRKAEDETKANVEKLMYRYMNPWPETFEEAVRRVMAAATALMIRKQRDYGPGNISAFGEYGVLVRVNDKIERLKNLLRPGQDNTPANESIEDTWMDLLNYACIALMLRRGWWDIPLAEEDQKPAQSDVYQVGKSQGGRVSCSHPPLTRRFLHLPHETREICDACGRILSVNDMATSTKPDTAR